MLTLSHYSRVNPSVNQPQLSIKKATVERSLDAESQFDTPEPDWNARTAAVLSVGIVVVGILSLMKGKNSFKPNSTVPRSSSRHNPKNQKNTTRLGSCSRELQNKLLRILHGDRQLAIRLLSQVRMKNPGRSTDWYVEKVIYDLDRDRGRW